jgi:hypothetical protein
MYPMMGQLITYGMGYPPVKGMVSDIKWTEWGRGKRCQSPYEMDFGWYAVYFDDGNILYGIGGLDGVIELNAQVLPDSLLLNKPCTGGGCKK